MAGGVTGKRWCALVDSFVELMDGVRYERSNEAKRRCVECEVASDLVNMVVVVSTAFDEGRERP